MILSAAVNRLLTSPESSDAKMESLGMRKLLPDAILKRTGRSTMVHQSRIRRNNLLYK